jgi:hypothetical protein
MGRRLELSHGEALALDCLVFDAEGNAGVVLPASGDGIKEQSNST